MDEMEVKAKGKVKREKVAILEGVRSGVGMMVERREHEGNEKRS